jgi:hypothetical protein
MLSGKALKNVNMFHDMPASAKAPARQPSPAFGHWNLSEYWVGWHAEP